MKKLMVVICALLLLTALSGCMLLLGGVNERCIGEFIPVYTDGENEFLEYELIFEDGLVMKTSDGFSLSELSSDDEALSGKDTGTEVLLDAYISALGFAENCAEGYEYLYDVLGSNFNIYDDDVFSETLILGQADDIYGAINFYSRPSGPSGSMLTNENIIKGISFSIFENEIEVVKEFNGGAVIAFNSDCCLLYRNRAFYSVSLTDGTEIFLLDDKWWDKGPSYYNTFDLSFTDEDFVAFGCVDNGIKSKETLITGKLDGSCITTLINE